MYNVWLIFQIIVPLLLTICNALLYFSSFPRKCFYHRAFCTPQRAKNVFTIDLSTFPKWPKSVFPKWQKKIFAHTLFKILKYGQKYFPNRPFLSALNGLNCIFNHLLACPNVQKELFPPKIFLHVQNAKQIFSTFICDQQFKWPKQKIPFKHFCIAQRAKTTCILSQVFLHSTNGQNHFPHRPFCILKWPKIFAKDISHIL